MPPLLHEYWENEDGGQFGPVRELTDKQRPKLLPNARFVFSLYASSWFEALQMEYDRLEFGEYIPPDGLPDEPYTADEEAEQNQYLKNRPPVR